MTHKKRMLSEAQKIFNLRREKSRKWAKKVGLTIKTAAKPMEGPYYWLRLGAKTILKAMPFPADSMETMDHADFWGALVNSDIAPFYGITDPQTIRELKNVPYAIPRGRVALMKRPLDDTKKFVVWHAEKMTDFQKKQVIEAFGLAAQFNAGLVNFGYDEHEGIIAADKARFDALIGSAKTRGKAKI